MGDELIQPGAGPQQSKEEVLDLIRKENPPISEDKKYKKVILLLEIKKANPKYLLIRGEYYEKDKIESAGSMVVPITQANQRATESTNSLQEGQSIFFGFSLDSKILGFTHVLKMFVKRSFENSSILDFLPWGGKANKT